MKKLKFYVLLAILLVVSLPKITSAQAGSCPGTPANLCNLINNGDFETNTGLPANLVYNPGQIGLDCPWTSYPGHTGTADCFSSLVPAGTSFYALGSVVGTEAPNSGTGYAGMATRWGPGGAGFREYFQQSLRCPLIAGVNYHLSFFVSLADNSEYGGEIKAALCPSLPAAAGFTAIVPPAGSSISPNTLLNTVAKKTGWTLVNYTFTANGGEQFIIIGNFNPTDAAGAAIFPGSGYANAAYVFVDDISLTVNSPLVISATPSTVPCGGTTVLTNNYNANINWTGGSLSCTSCVSPTTGALNTTTTFSGTIMYCTGCSETATTTVTVTPLAVTATATPSTLTPPTLTSSTLTATVTGGVGPFTYSWTPTTSLSNPSIQSPVASPTVTTVYTCVATNAAGCSATTTVTVFVNPSTLCTLPYDYNLTTTTTAAAFPALSGVTGKNIHINGTLTVNSSFNFSGCNIVLEAGSIIQTSGAGTVLYVTGQTHIYTCSGMWNGISLVSGTSAQIMNSSIIEDAIRAVTINAGATAQIEYCTFNKNYTAVELTANTSTTSPLSMIGCVVTCRDFPTYTNVILNPTALAVWTNIYTGGAGIYPSTFMKAPYFAYKSIYGVFATDVNTLQVGSDFAATNFNGFDNVASTGIYLTRTNATIYNNQFRNITNASNCFTCTPLIGVAIYGTGNATSNYSIKVGGVLVYQLNKFNDVYSSIDVNNYQTNAILNNIISNSITTTPTFGGMGKSGIQLKAAANNTVKVLNNNITNCATAIAVYRNTLTASQIVTLQIDNNSITANSTGFCTTGIYFTDAPTATLTTATSEIAYNTIIESANCISILKVKPKNDVYSNSCMTRYASTGSLNGIKLDGCTNQTVYQNHTKYNVGTAALSGGNVLAYGIYSKNNTNGSIRCNLIEDAASSFVFEGNYPNANAYSQNTFRRAQNGLVLLTATTVIGTQGTSLVPSNNYWDLTFPMTCHIVNNSTTALTLWVNSPTSGPTATQPTIFCGSGTNSINVTGAAGPTACGPVPARLAGPQETQTTAAEPNLLMLVFPNPNNGSFSIQTNSSEAKDIFVYDVMGNVVLEMKQVSEENNSIDITNQASGIYIVHVVTGNSVETQRIIKQ